MQTSGIAVDVHSVKLNIRQHDASLRNPRSSIRKTKILSPTHLTAGHIWTSDVKGHAPATKLIFVRSSHDLQPTESVFWKNIASHSRNLIRYSRHSISESKVNYPPRLKEVRGWLAGTLEPDAVQFCFPVNDSLWRREEVRSRRLAESPLWMLDDILVARGRRIRS